ncbi:MAG TPA: sugar phosphate isomerase/epimerase [Sphingobacteriaceae bacterium]|nr:sugar phosphate isomerase/epimerase [Sphingobacteriaceae bacterium]
MIRRREFLKNIGMLTAGLALQPSYTSALKKVKNVGIQLYTFRKEMLVDAHGTLQQLASLGIKQIESASSIKGRYYGLSPKEIKHICDDLGMKLISGHAEFNNNWQQAMDEAAESGQEYLITSNFPSQGQTVDNYKRVADSFNKAGEACKRLSIKFGYHNHNAQFREENGQVLYDVLLNNTDPDLVHMELDLGWMIAAGKKPIDYFNKYRGRFPLWHLKDMKGMQSTEFGKGNLDIVTILRNRKLAGLKHFFVEQEEYTHTPLESMKQNMEYLGKIKI